MMFDLPPIELPLWFLLIPLGIFGLFFILYSFFNVYHLLRFATFSLGTYFITIVFVGGTIIIAALFYNFFFSHYDWTLTWSLSDFLEFKSVLKKI